MDDFLKTDQLKILSKYWLFLQKKENLKIKNGFGFMKSHSCFVSMFNNWFTNYQNTAGYIYIIRDPRDIVISWSKHADISLDDSINFLINFNSCIEWAQSKSNLPANIKPKTFVSSWDEHVLSWTENSLNVPSLILKYEDIIYYKEKTVEQIIKFFYDNFKIEFKNKQEKISNIIKSTSFKNLQNIEREVGFSEANAGPFFRKGEKNQWKKELNEQQIKKIENKFRDFMNKFGYE